MSVVYARLLWVSAGPRTLLALVLAAGTAASTTVGVVATGQFIGSLREALAAGAVSPAASRTWFWLGVTAAVFIAGPLLSAATAAVAQDISARFLRTFYDLAMEAGVAPHGVAHLEDAGFAGRLDAVINATRQWDFTAGLESTWAIISIRLTGVGSFLVLASWRWWAPLLVAASYAVLARVYSWWAYNDADDVLDVSGDERRRARYLRTLLVDPGPAKEVRLFGLPGWLLQRYSASWRAAMTTVWRNRSRGLGRVMLTATGLLVTNGAVFAVLARDASAGAVSLAAVVTFVQALLALEAFGPLGDHQVALVRCAAATSQLARLRSELGLRQPPARQPEPPTRPPNRPTPTGPRPGTAATVEFDEVTFTYPTRAEPTFSGLTLHVPAGQSVAIVGANGAGKSTLVKLLCGLYAPDAGTVRVDGLAPSVDDATRRRVAVIFQEFVHYQLSLRRNVAFGATTRDGDIALAHALDRAGGLGLLRQLPRGWDTILSPAYDGGTDLSGGQWQRVALARALAAVAAGAGILVLDEPTAALDVRAEKELFDRFLDVTGGMTTLLVSHRLSSVRHADRIVVIGTDDLGRGRIIEDGGHDQLIAAGGDYARMFTLQARRFAAAGASASAGNLDEEPTP